MSVHSGFQPGDHLQVQRPGLYHHHGIYISDDRVIVQFGSGINLLDKSWAAVNAVSLDLAKRAGSARKARLCELVRHRLPTTHRPTSNRRLLKAPSSC